MQNLALLMFGALIVTVAFVVALTTTSMAKVVPLPRTKWLALMPSRGMISEQPAGDWRDALVSGNGRMGAMVYGAPDERVILTHHKFNQPQSPEPVPVPKMAAYLPELKRLIREGKQAEAMKFWARSLREAGHPIALNTEDRKQLPNIIWTDAFHPGYALDVRTGPRGEVGDYLRSTDFETGEIAVVWTDNRGAWRSRLFVSRADDIVAHELQAPEGARVDIEVDENLEGLRGPYRTAWPRVEGDYKARFSTAYAAGQSAEEARITVRAHYHPERSKRGFEGVTRVIAPGARISTDDERLRVRGATTVLLLTRLTRLEDYEASQVDAVTGALASFDACYDDLLEKHAAIHRPIYNRVRLDLGEGAERQLSAEALLRMQKEHGGDTYMNPALLEKMFDMGRYVFLCSSGDWPPRLPGIWTGSWDPAWQGDFTLDANVNLAVSGGNIGALLEPMQGYVRLTEDIKADWETNARNLYGCRGLMAGTRTDGEHNLHTHHSTGFPGHFWLAGAEWLTLPLQEYYEVTGDKAFLRTHVLPLLKDIVLFFEDFLTERDENGKYVFIPSYSPENVPANADQGATINATMDIAAAKEALTYLIGHCERLGLEAENLPRWRAMLAAMPPYLINSDGALKEWAHPELEDNYNHRHLSHLYPVWPGHEINPEETPELFEAARKAARLRQMGNQSAHGIMHMGLVAARLKEDAIVGRNLRHLLQNDYIYRSLVTSHNPNHKIYNVDASCSLPAVVMEMLVYSRPGVVELLPALPEALGKGTIEGVLCRGQIRVDRLSWDVGAKEVEATLTSARNQEIALLYRKGIETVEVDGQSVTSQDGKSVTLRLEAGRQHRVRINGQKREGPQS